MAARASLRDRDGFCSRAPYFMAEYFGVKSSDYIEHDEPELKWKWDGQGDSFEEQMMLSGKKGKVSHVSIALLFCSASIPPRRKLPPSLACAHPTMPPANTRDNGSGSEDGFGGMLIRYFVCAFANSRVL